jgi:hypothetical protein
MISLISGTSSGSGGTITILNTTTGISAPVTQGQWLLDVTVQYTATAADAGKFIGIAIDNVSGTGNWIEFDNVRLTASAPPPANTFASWIGGFSLDPAHTGFGDDADGDNLANGVEAWFGTHPGQFNAGVRNLSSDGTNTTFDHPQNDDPPGDLTGYYEWSPNLSDWYPSGSGPVGGPTVSFAPNTVGTTTTVTATASDPLDQLFLRVGVMQE